MVLRGWLELPTGSRRLITYYALSSIPLAVYVFFPIYMYMLGFSLELVGSLFMIYYALIAISKYIVGKLLDIRVSPKKCMIVIDTLGSLENVVYSFAQTPSHFIIAFVISSIISPLYVAYRTIEKDLYPSDKLELAYRHHMFWPYLAELGSILGMGVVIWLSGNPILCIRQLFLFTAILHVLMAAYIYVYIPDTGYITLKSEKKHKSGTLFNKALIYFAIAEILIIFAFSLIPGFILQNYLFNILGFSIIIIAIIETIDAAFRGGASILHEKIESSGTFNVLVISLLVSGIAGVLMYVSQFPSSFIYVFLIIVLSTVFMGVGESMWWIQHEAVFLKQVSEERRGETFGFVSSIRELISIFTPYITAFIASRINPLIPFLLYSIIMFVTIPLYKAGLLAAEKRNKMKL